MQLLFPKRPNQILIVSLIVVLVIIFISTTLHSRNTQNNQVTATVERGTVTETIAVSGYVEAKNTADLSFPSTGIVTGVMVEKGTMVKQGDILATLGARTLVAQRTEATAALRKAQAAYDTVVAGPREESRIVTAKTQAAAEQSYDQTVAVEAEKVRSTRTALLSNDLTAYANNADTAATAPTITGSYTCEQEGVYYIDLYRSSTDSGYSYSFSGLEFGTDSAYTQQSAPLGTCGLMIQFTAGDVYRDSSWIIPVPNKNSATYITYKNAYDLALENQDAAVQAAANARDLATAQATLATAAPTTYEVNQASAAVRQASAAVAAIDAQIAEKSIIAPFDGIVTSVDIVPGEIAGITPIITLIAEDAFTLTARIPEIDITKVDIGHKAATIFDAQSDETVLGTVTFVSPLATEIDGVGYFETTITLDETPSWMRAGLNADIDIFTHEETNVLKLPKRFITQKEGTTYVLSTDGTEVPITVVFYGNDGYAAITGINEGDIIVAPDAP